MTTPTSIRIRKGSALERLAAKAAKRGQGVNALLHELAAVAESIGPLTYEAMAQNAKEGVPKL